MSLGRIPSRRVTARSALAMTLLLMLSGAGASPATASEANRGPEVSPGVFMASAAGERDGQEAERATLRHKIFDGTASTIRRWPWQVSIGYLPIDRNDAHKNHLCGGSLVAPTIVVTAAHCMTLGPNTNFRPSDEFEVVTGRTRLSSDAGELHELADYHWFVDRDGRPLWNPDTREWDVVFLELATPASEDTIKIAGSGEEVVWIPGQRAFVTGWGLTRERNELGPDRLRQGRVKTVSDSACNSVWGPLLFSSVMTCAGASDKVDACAGDSGGPLVVPIAGGGYRLIGSVSFGADCGTRGVPGVYGRLASAPIRTALQRGIQRAAGVNVVGSGAEPPSRFGFGPLRRNPARGTGSLLVRVPGRGKLRIHRTDSLRRAVVFPSAAGAWRLPVKLRGEAGRRLSRTGRSGARARVTYEGFGDSRTKSIRVRLVKRG